ncbi:Uncharacterized protein APZ42_025563 [Daphnia magna]|uniref:Uncharacterized protein n=1 Tax=Daphnia magna TaxID=35525 RepID=A0A164SYR9_9CRUS|nr:Uncharacterized protein APZ42_025563 [Daphnia magna]
MHPATVSVFLFVSLMENDETSECFLIVRQAVQRITVGPHSICLYVKRSR